MEETDVVKITDVMMEKLNEYSKQQIQKATLRQEKVQQAHEIILKSAHDR